MINNFPSKDTSYRYLQTNRGDSIGNLWSSMNLDFQSNYGVMRLAPRMLLNTETTNTSEGLPIAFCEFANSLWALSGTRIYRTNSNQVAPDSSFSSDSSSGALTTYTFDDDITTFDGRLFASNTAGLYAKSSYAGPWSLITSSPNSGILQYFRKFDRLYVSQATSKVESLSNTDVYAASSDYTITLTSNQEIVCMCETSDSIWIGTKNNQDLSARGSIFRWDGISAQATERYYVEANEVKALITKNDIPYCMDSNGALLQFTGSSFEEVGRIPFGDALKLPRDGNVGFIHRRGMTVTKNDTILCLISNIYEDSTFSAPENVPSGVWEWSSDIGFTHKYSLSYTPRQTTTITDYGQNKIWEPGALANVNTFDDRSTRNGSLLAGAEYFVDNTDSSPDRFAIFYDDTIDTSQKKGYFVTTWFDSDEIQDQWQRLWVVYKRFFTSTDSIVMKYRTTEEDPVVANITWVNTTSFTTTTDITAYGPLVSPFNGTVGGEVEFIQGTGSGACVHITNIVNNAGTYTVTIDEAVTGVTTGTGKARFQKWVKLNPTEPQNQVKEFSQMGIDTSSPSIQIKGCLTFTGPDEFIKMALVSNEDIKITS